jgi:hypothetical protein
LAAGEVILPVPVQYHETIDALLTSGRISECDALDRKKVAAALSEILVEWRNKWADYRHA